MSCIEVKEQITAAMEPEYEFIDFIAFSNTIIDKTDKDATREWYQTALSSLCWFYNRKKIDIRDVTAQRLNEFKQQLSISGQKGKPLSPGGISNYLRAILGYFHL